MDKLIKLAVRNRTLTLFTVMLVALMGIKSFLGLPQNEDPPINVRAVQVITYWPGATPEDVELYISKPIENSIAKQDNVSKIISQSLPGVSVVWVDISEYAADDEVKLAFQQIRNYILDSKGDLPDGIYGPVINDRFGETSAYVIGIVSESGRHSYRELESLGTQIRDKIRTIEGVGDLDFYGVQEEKIYIDLSTIYSSTTVTVTPDQIIHAVQSQNIQIAQPTLYLADKRILLEVTGTYKTIDQIRDTIIYTDKEGRIYRLKDLVGKIWVGYEDPPKKVTQVDGKKSIIMAISMKRGQHIVHWGEKVDAMLEEINADLPQDIKLVILSHQPKGVQKAVDGFMENFYEAIVLVILVIGLGMGLRSSGIVAIAIPLIMLATFALMTLFKRELHQMSINALIIALGMVVDNAVVITDNVQRYMGMGYKKVDAAYLAAREVKIALMSGTITTVASFLPLALMPGDVGQYIMDLPIVISIALFVSYAVAMFVTPTCAAVFLPDKLKKKKDKKKDSDKKSLGVLFYYAIIDFTQKFKFLTVLVLLLLFAGSIYVAFNFIPVSFFPAADKSQFVINVWLPNGWDLPGTSKVVHQIEKRLDEMKSEKITEPSKALDFIYGYKRKPQPLVVSYCSYIGGGGPRFFIGISPEPDQLHYAQFLVNTSTTSHTEEAIARLKKFSNENISGAIIQIEKLETGPPVAAPIQIRVAGTEIQTLKNIAQEIQNILIQTPGITTVSNTYGYDTSKLVIRVDQEKAKMLGLSSEDIAVTLLVGFEGYSISRYKAPERQIDIVLRLLAPERKSLEQVKATLFTSSSSGMKYRLDEFAQIYMDTGTSSIMRYNQTRTLTINALIEEGELPSVLLEKIRPKIAEVKLDKGYSIEYGGQDEASSKAFGDLAGLAVMALMLLLLILAYQFKSLKIAMAIYVSIPFAFIGSIAGMFIMKQPLSFMSALGLISLAGVVVNNAILMIEFIQENMKEGKELLMAIKEAGIVRFRPIMLTTVTTLAGMLPLALYGGSLFAPMCWVIIFGLSMSTVLTLLVVPLFFVLLGGYKDAARLIAEEKEGLEPQIETDEEDKEEEDKKQDKGKNQEKPAKEVKKGDQKGIKTPDKEVNKEVSKENKKPDTKKEEGNKEDKPDNKEE